MRLVRRRGPQGQVHGPLDCGESFLGRGHLIVICLLHVILAVEGRSIVVKRVQVKAVLHTLHEVFLIWRLHRKLIMEAFRILSSASKDSRITGLHLLAPASQRLLHLIVLILAHHFGRAASEVRSHQRRLLALLKLIDTLSSVCRGINDASMPHLLSLRLRRLIGRHNLTTGTGH